MSSITGFGSINGVVESTNNCNLVVLLPPRGSKRIFDISAGYSLRRGSGVSNTKLTLGRLLVVGTRFDVPNAFIQPDDYETPALGNAKIYFDAPICADHLSTVSIQKSFNWVNGLLIPDNEDTSIILTCCFGDGSAPPAASAVNAYLNVSGLTSDSDKIFKNV